MCLSKMRKYWKRSEKVDTIVVDKTGTLTQGQPKLTECIPVDSGSDDELLLRLAASLEQSEHPLARAIVEGAQNRNLELSAVDDFDSITGAAFADRWMGQKF
ncbi:MAG: HAD family hydrolase [Pirellulaceae bacterium]